MGAKKWTYEACYEVALTCKSRNEMKKKYPYAYKTSWKHGWLDKFTWFDKPKTILFYTEEKCLELVKKCKTLKEFRTKFPYAYNSARKHNWLDNYDWLERECPADNWKSVVYAFFYNEQHAVYIGITNNKNRRNEEHHKDKRGTNYKFAQKHNIQIPDMVILKDNLSPEPEGLYWEDYYVKKYKEDGWTVLNKAKTGIRSGSIGRLSENRLTKKKCYEISLDCTTRTELQKKHPGVYQKVLKNNWFDEFKHILPPIKTCALKWTHEKIMKEVYNNDTYKDFKTKSRKAYDAAWYRGMLSEIKAYYDKRA